MQSTSTSSYWLINTMYQPVPPSKYHHKSYSNVRLSFVHLRWAELYVSLVSKYLFLDPVQKWCNWVKSNTQTHWKSWRWCGGLLEIVCLQSCSWCNWRKEWWVINWNTVPHPSPKLTTPARTCLPSVTTVNGPPLSPWLGIMSLCLGVFKWASGSDFSNHDRIFCLCFFLFRRGFWHFTKLESQ